ncbi:MAG: hypothetical protein ACYC6C_10375 [Coriobacteriia bacterium]
MLRTLGCVAPPGVSIALEIADPVNAGMDYTPSPERFARSAGVRAQRRSGLLPAVPAMPAVTVGRRWRRHEAIGVRPMIPHAIAGAADVGDVAVVQEPVDQLCSPRRLLRGAVARHLPDAANAPVSGKAVPQPSDFDAASPRTLVRAGLSSR